ncbi:PAS domain-containing protein [Candidatus Fermentibacteria bacterium]|nr:PAS domain-containing protein [Candidatus Fermentibacteria bacterium]
MPYSRKTTKGETKFHVPPSVPSCSGPGISNIMRRRVNAYRLNPASSRSSVSTFGAVRPELSSAASQGGTLKTGAVLLKMMLSEGRVASVEATGESPPRGLEGSEASSLFDSWPPEQHFRPNLLRTPEAEIPAAVRTIKDSANLLVYYFEPGSKLFANPWVPVVRLHDDLDMPAVSPGFVSLTGYTPWELLESDLLHELARSASSGTTTRSIVDRRGRNLELLCQSVPTPDGGRDLIFATLPAYPLQKISTTLSRWERVPEELCDHFDYLLEALGLSGGMLLTLFGEDRLEILCDSDLGIREEDLEDMGIGQSCRGDRPLWLDLDPSDHHLDVPDEQLLIYPFGLGRRFALLAPCAGNAESLQRSASVLLPYLGARLEALDISRKQTRYEQRRQLLERIEEKLTKHSITDYAQLDRILPYIAEVAGTCMISLLPPDTSKGPLATWGSAPMEDVDSGKGGDSNAVATVMLRDGYSLRATFKSAKSADHSLLESFGRMLERFCARPPAEPRRSEDQPPFDVTSLPAVLVEGFSVSWQGAEIDLEHCYEFYGRSSPCRGCPLLTESEERQLPGTMTYHSDQGYIELISSSGEGHLILWVHAWKPEAPTVILRNIPSGAALYDTDGYVRSWNGWMEEMTGVPAKRAVGQRAVRLVEKLGSERVELQLRRSLEGVSMKDPVEFELYGRRCLSRIVPLPDEGSLLHFVLDSGVTVDSLALPLMQGGIRTRSEGPSSLASALSSAAEAIGLDFDLSPAAAERSPSWLTSGTASKLLEHVMGRMREVCPERWLSMDVLKVGPQTDLALDGGPILPGSYLSMSFTGYPMLLQSHRRILSLLSKLLRGFGGWLSLDADSAGITIALPQALQQQEGNNLLLYSKDETFGELSRSILSRAKADFKVTSSLGELARMQPTSAAVAARLLPGELVLLPALKSRMPHQPLLLASGLWSAIPTLGLDVRILRLPAEENTVLGAYRDVLHDLT